jgi:hypothetical protein
MNMALTFVIPDAYFEIDAVPWPAHNGLLLSAQHNKDFGAKRVNVRPQNFQLVRTVGDACSRVDNEAASSAEREKLGSWTTIKLRI